MQSLFGGRAGGQTETEDGDVRQWENERRASIEIFKLKRVLNAVEVKGGGAPNELRCSLLFEATLHYLVQVT